MSVLFVSVIVLSILRWAVDNALLGINVLAYSLVLGGRVCVRRVGSPIFGGRSRAAYGQFPVAKSRAREPGPQPPNRISLAPVMQKG